MRDSEQFSYTTSLLGLVQWLLVFRKWPYLPTGEGLVPPDGRRSNQA